MVDRVLHRAHRRLGVVAAVQIVAAAEFGDDAFEGHRRPPFQSSRSLGGVHAAGKNRAARDDLPAIFNGDRGIECCPKPVACTIPFGIQSLRQPYLKQSALRKSHRRLRLLCRLLLCGVLHGLLLRLRYCRICNSSCDNRRSGLFGSAAHQEQDRSDDRELGGKRATATMVVFDQPQYPRLDIAGKPRFDRNGRPILTAAVTRALLPPP